jgi:hypothetical protein
MINTGSKTGNSPYSASTRDELGHTKMSPSTAPSSRLQKSRTVRYAGAYDYYVERGFGFRLFILDYFVCVLHVREKFRSGGHSFYTRSESGLLYSLFA